MILSRDLMQLKLTERRSPGDLLERKRAVAHADLDAAARNEFAFQDALREGIFDLLLDGALQRPRTVHRIESRLGNEVARLVIEHEAHVALEKPRAQEAQLYVDDGTDL